MKLWDVLKTNVAQLYQFFFDVVTFIVCETTYLSSLVVESRQSPNIIHLGTDSMSCHVMSIKVIDKGLT